MDPRLSIFLNSFAVMTMGACTVYMVLGAMYPLRRSLCVFVGYRLFLGVCWSIYDISYVLGTLGTFEHDYQIVATALFGVLNFVVVYYTWDGEFANIGLGTLFGETLVCISSMAMFFLTHELFNTVSATDYRGYFGWNTVFMCFGILGITAVMVRLAKPLFSKLGGHEFAHKKAWRAVVVFMIAIPTVLRMFSADQIRESVLSLVLVLCFAAVALTAYLLNKIRVERKRRGLLEREAELADAYDCSIREQLSFLNASSACLDEMLADVARIESRVDDVGMRERVARLHEACDALRYGAYSDCPALDVVLCASEDELAKKALRVEYRVSPLGDAAIQAALVSQAMLAWVAESFVGDVRAGKGLGDSGGGYAIQPGISFRIIRSAGQLAFILKMPSNRRRRFPRRLLEERVVSFEGVVQEADDGRCKTVRALVAET